MNQYVPKEITEEVNVTPVHPLVNLGYLIVTVLISGALIYAGLGLIAHQLVIRIDSKTEENIGAALSTPFIADASQNEQPADRRLAYLRTLLADLQRDALQTDLPAAVYPPLKVHILETPVENAMVTAGSYVFVTEGLLAAVESENELAFVLAHELGHLQYRDPLKALGRSLVWISLNSLLGVGQVQLPGMMTNAANLSELSYSRTQETTADAYAINVIMARYRHGAHSLDFFERAQHNELDLGVFTPLAEWNQTHPRSSDRIQRLESTFLKNGWPMTGDATPLPQNFGCRNFEPCD